MSQFLRAQDFFTIPSRQSANMHWNSLIQIITEYEQLIQIQKKQISQVLEQTLSIRNELLHKFCQFKDSLKYQGQTVKKQILIIKNDKMQHFFPKYEHNIEQMVHKIVLKPELLAKLLKKYGKYKKHKFAQFSQNLAFMIYPSIIQKNSNNINFIKFVISNWSYDIDLYRPVSPSAFDQIIYGYLKTPQVTSYIECLAMNFLAKINSAKIDFFAFDQEAVKNQLETKKMITVSYNPPKQKSIWKKIFGRKGKDDLQMPGLQHYSSSPALSHLQAFDEKQEKKNILEIMKHRQQPLIAIIAFTIQLILKQQIPLLLKQMMTFFHYFILEKYRQSNKKIPQANQLYRHYCYFLLTNFILSELHSKFTISYQGSAMTHADLQNISQIIRVITAIFQGNQPDNQKYRILQNIKDYRQNVKEFYKKIIITKVQQDYSINDSFKEIQPQYKQQVKISSLMERHFENTIFLSFNDLRIITDALRNFLEEKKNIELDNQIYQELNLSKQLQSLQFLKNQSGSLFESKKNINFKNKVYDAENIVFIFSSVNPSTKNIIEHYTDEQSPLKYLPLISNILMHQSNLTVSETLEVTQSLNLIKKLPLKEMKHYLIKTAIRFNKLYLKDNDKLQQIFRQSILSFLKENIQKKAGILQAKESFIKKMQYQKKIIDNFKNNLKSSQFYLKISQKFIKNAYIKIYLNIQHNLFKLHTTLNELKGLRVQNLMVSKDFDSKSTKSSEDYMLRHSFKTFQNISEVIRCVGNHPITSTALIKGRKVEQFNSFFTSFCEIIVKQIESFLHQNEILQNLNKQKFEKVVVHRLQDMIYERVFDRPDRIIEDDIKLRQAQSLINKQQFYLKDLKHLNLEIQFLLISMIELFQQTVSCRSIQHKLYLFEQFFKVMYTIVAFSIPRGKISAEIVNPIFQYIIAQCPPLNHYQCLNTMKCLKWRQVAQTNYNLTLYQSSLAYVVQYMPKQYPLKMNVSLV